MYVAHTYVTGFHITRLPHTQNQTYAFYQKWIAGLIHYHIPLCISFRTGKSGFCSSFLLTLHVKATSGGLVPLNGHGFVVVVCSELGLHRELTSGVLNLFGVI